MVSSKPYKMCFTCWKGENQHTDRNNFITYKMFYFCGRCGEGHLTRLFVDDGGYVYTVRNDRLIHVYYDEGRYKETPWTSFSKDVDKDFVARLTWKEFISKWRYSE